MTPQYLYWLHLHICLDCWKICCMTLRLRYDRNCVKVYPLTRHMLSYCNSLPLCWLVASVYSISKTYSLHVSHSVIITCTLSITHTFHVSVTTTAWFCPTMQCFTLTDIPVIPDLEDQQDDDLMTEIAIAPT